jgi:hypothetical protein
MHHPVHPDRALLWIERIVRHDYLADTRHLQHPLNVPLESLRFEEGPCFGQVRSIGRQVECLEHSNDPARGL